MRFTLFLFRGFGVLRDFGDLKTGLSDRRFGAGFFEFGWLDRANCKSYLDFVDGNYTR